MVLKSRPESIDRRQTNFNQFSPKEMLQSVNFALILLLLCLQTQAAFGYHEEFSDKFDESTVAHQPWPWLDDNAASFSKVCAIAVEKKHYGRILACERLERLFFSLDSSKRAEKNSNVRHAIKILKSPTDRFVFGSDDTPKEELVGILKDLFQMDGGTLWRVGLVHPQQQYPMTLWILDKLDEMTLE